MSDLQYDAIDALPDEDVETFQREMDLVEAVEGALAAVTLGYAAEFGDETDRRQFFAMLKDQLPES